MTDDLAETEKRAQIYESRNGNLQRTIDVLSQYSQSELNEWGKKAEIAREHDLESSRVTYVLNEWPELVRWRRHANANPLDPDAVKEAYDDDTMAAMASGNQEAIADGVGNVTVSFDLNIDEAFRAVKILPGDLGVKIFAQVMQDAENLPHDAMEDLLGK